MLLFSRLCNSLVLSSIDLLVFKPAILMLILVLLLLFLLIENSLGNRLNSRSIEQVVIIISEEIGRKNIG
jgi:hypothetical protein